MNIVETLGEHVCSFYLREWDGDADAAEPLAQARRSQLVLEDGSVVGSISTAFTDTDDGCTARLSVTLPESCGPAVLDQHLEHFAVEFRSWILRAAAELRDLAPLAERV